jgi:hypothetical protein
MQEAVMAVSMQAATAAGMIVVTMAALTAAVLLAVIAATIALSKAHRARPSKH